MSLSNKLFNFFNKAIVEEYADFPGPPPSFPFGNALDFLGAQPWEVTTGFAANYGPIYVVWFANKPQIAINAPEYFRAVLVDKSWKQYHKDSPIEALEPVITKYTPFLANPPQWKSMRKRDPFSSTWFDDWLQAQIAPLRASLVVRSKELAETSKLYTLDSLPVLQRMSFDAFSISAIGKYLPDKIYDLFVSLGKTGSKRLTTLFLTKKVLNPFFYPKRKKWLGYFKEQIANSYANPNDAATDLLQWVRRYGSELSDEAATASTADIFYGGAYSVTSVLVTAFYFLGLPENREILDTFKKAAKKLFHEKPNFTYADLQEVEILEQIIRECMRIFPPVPFYSRNSSTTQVLYLNDYRVPTNTPIIISNYYLQRSDKHWDEPLTFQPSRWTKEVRKNNPYDSDYFFPFGRGPRACMGMPFALMYIRIALISFYAHARFELATKANYEQSFFFGVMLPKGVKGKVLLDQEEKGE
ncbi:MAG: cytochrome P450 [Spirochaetota bacterium]